MKKILSIFVLLGLFLSNPAIGSINFQLEDSDIVYAEKVCPTCGYKDPAGNQGQNCPNGCDDIDE